MQRKSISFDDLKNTAHWRRIDRLWTLWQSLDFKNRTDQVFGTSTLQNSEFCLLIPLSSADERRIMNLADAIGLRLDPPSPPVTLASMVNMGVLGANLTLNDLKSTIDGPFCYMYV